VKTASRDGAAALDDVRTFIGRFCALPTEHAYTATALWAAHAHVLDAFDSTPRLAFLSPEPGSGKTRALEVLTLLVPWPMHAVNATPAALFRSVADPATRRTILLTRSTRYSAPKPKSTRNSAACSTPGTAAPASPTGASAKAPARLSQSSPPTPPWRWPGSANCPTPS
jgi:hypothetical protein